MKIFLLHLSLIHSYQCDVADFDQVKETVQAVQKDLGGVDILVNNAGITRDGLVYTMKEADVYTRQTISCSGLLWCGCVIMLESGRPVRYNRYLCFPKKETVPPSLF